jgi:hypothetical protein
MLWRMSEEDMPSLGMPHAEPDLSATLLANLKAYVAGGVIEASENV